MCQRSECYLVETGYGYELNGEHLFKRNEYIPYKTLPIFVNKRRSYSSFCTAYRYNITDIEHAELYGDLYFDFDDINDFEKVRVDALRTLSYLKIVFQIPSENVLIYYSGNKGIHLIVPAEILDIEPHNRLNGIYKTIANYVKDFTPNKTLDTQIYDNKRLFRIPNTINEKSKLYKIAITVDELRNLSEDEIKDMAKSKRNININHSYVSNITAKKQYLYFMDRYYEEEAQQQGNGSKRFRSTLNFVPPCIKNLLDNGAQEGSRNVSIACLSGFYKNFGKTLDETIALITEWNDNNVKPTGQSELTKTIKSIFNSNKQYGCSTLKTVSLCDPKNCRLSKKE